MDYDQSCFYGDSGAFSFACFLLLARLLGLFFIYLFEFQVIILDFLACLHGHGENAYSFMLTMASMMSPTTTTLF